jgi:predicted TIM-barrel fold metal-dependent hydrolase
MPVVIDAHAHLFDDSVPGAAEIYPRWGGDLAPVRGVDGLLAQMDEAGIDRAFVLGMTATDVAPHFPPEKRHWMESSFQHVLSREVYLSAWTAHRDRLDWFPDSHDPRVPGYVERAERDLKMGAAGLKILNAFVDTAVDDPLWFPIYELLVAHDKPCIIDPSYWYLDDPTFAPSLAGRYRDYAEFAEGFHAVAARYPRLRMQIAHFGTPKIRIRRAGTVLGLSPDAGVEIDYASLEGPIELMRPHPNFYCELSAYEHFIPRDEAFPFWTALKIVEIVVAGLGADRVIWGTDWPFVGHKKYPELIRAIRQAPFLGPGDADKILGENALRLVAPTKVAR